MQARVRKKDTGEIICNVELQVPDKVPRKGAPFVAILGPGDAELGVDPPEGLLIFETDTGQRYEGFSQSGAAGGGHAYFRGTLGLLE